MDLLDFFRNRYSWAKLERLLSQLPTRSRYKLAMLDDDEFADRIVAEAEKSGKSDAGPSLEDWTPEAPYLAAAVDRLGEVVAALVGLGGRKPPKVHPLPRPRTAIDRARTRRSWDRHHSLVSEIEEARARRQASHQS